MSDRQMANAIADRMIRTGWYWVAGGLVVTLIGYSAAEPGGGYVVFWGAPLFGLYRVFQGFRLKSKIK
jgi:hypothetical protein